MKVFDALVAIASLVVWGAVYLVIFLALGLAGLVAIAIAWLVATVGEVLR